MAGTTGEVFWRSGVGGGRGGGKGGFCRRDGLQRRGEEGLTDGVCVCVCWKDMWVVSVPNDSNECVCVCAWGICGCFCAKWNDCVCVYATHAE